MLTVCNLNGLRPFGIDLLTGEADALSFRVLCDLSPLGKRIFCDAYGIPADAQLADNWNSGGVASVMLADEAWRQLGVIALLRRDGGDCHTVIATEHGLYGLEAGELYLPEEFEEHPDEEDWRKRYTSIQPPRIQQNGPTGSFEMRWPNEAYGKIQRIFRVPQNMEGRQPVVGFRNLHMMSGRAE